MLSATLLTAQKSGSSSGLMPASSSDGGHAGGSTDAWVWIGPNSTRHEASAKVIPKPHVGGSRSVPSPILDRQDVDLIRLIEGSEESRARPAFRAVRRERGIGAWRHPEPLGRPPRFLAQSARPTQREQRTSFADRWHSDCDHAIRFGIPAFGLRCLAVPVNARPAVFLGHQTLPPPTLHTLRPFAIHDGIEESDVRWRLRPRNDPSLRLRIASKSPQRR